MIMNNKQSSAPNNMAKAPKSMPKLKGNTAGRKPMLPPSAVKK